MKYKFILFSPWLLKSPVILSPKPSTLSPRTQTQVLFSRGMLRDPRFAKILLATGAGLRDNKTMEVLEEAGTGFMGLGVEGSGLL